MGGYAARRKRSRSVTEPQFERAMQKQADTGAMDPAYTIEQRLKEDAKKAIKETPVAAAKQVIRNAGRDIKDLTYMPAGLMGLANSISQDVDEAIPEGREDLSRPYVINGVTRYARNEPPITTLPKAIKTMTTGRTAKLIGKTMGEQIKKEVTQPTQALADNPVWSALDYISAASLLLGGVGAVARPAAGVMRAASTMGKAGEIGRLAKAANVVEKVGRGAESISTPSKVIGLATGKAKAAAKTAGMTEEAANTLRVSQELVNKGEKSRMVKAGLSADEADAALDSFRGVITPETKDAYKSQLIEKGFKPEQADQIINAAVTGQKSGFLKRQVENVGGYLNEREAAKAGQEAYNVTRQRQHAMNEASKAEVMDLPKKEFKAKFKRDPNGEELLLAQAWASRAGKEVTPELVNAYKASPGAQELYSFIQKDAAATKQMGIEAGHFDAITAERRRFAPAAVRAVKQELVNEHVAEMAAKGRTVDLKSPEAAQALEQRLAKEEQLYGKDIWDKRVEEKIDELQALPPEQTANLAYYYPITKKAEERQAGLWGRYPGNIAEEYDPGFNRQFLGGAEHHFDPYEGALRWREMYNKKVARDLGKARVMQEAERIGVKQVVPPGGSPRIGYTEIQAPDIARARRAIETINYARNKVLPIVGSSATKGVEQTIGKTNLANQIAGNVADIAGRRISNELQGSKYAIMQKARETERVAVPTRMWTQLEPDISNWASSLPIRLWDAGTREMKALMLATFRWAGGNLAGNALFTAAQQISKPRQALRSWRKAFNAEWAKSAPVAAEAVQGGLHATEMRGAGGVGERAISELVGKIFPGQSPVKTVSVAGITGDVANYEARNWGRVASYILPSKLLKRWFNFNQSADNAFRRAGFYFEAENKAREEISRLGFKQAAVQDQVDDMMKGLINDPMKSMDISKAAADYWFNYANLSRLERGVVNRVTMFYPWVRKSAEWAIYTMPANHPVKSMLGMAISQAGKEWVEDWFMDHGLTKEQYAAMPEYVRGGIPISYDAETDTYKYVNLMSYNPITTVSGMNLRRALNTLHPAVALAFERALHEDLFTGRKFDSPYSKEMFGRTYQYNPSMPGGLQQIEGVNPSLGRHAVKKLVPQSSFVESAYLASKNKGVVPAQYSTGELKPARPGAPERKFSTKVLNLLGVPISYWTPPKQKDILRSQQAARTGIFNQVFKKGK